jgi:hypothetical protein
MAHRRCETAFPRSIRKAEAFVPASIVLQRLHDAAPPDHFTLGWPMGSLRKRSFGRRPNARTKNGGLKVPTVSRVSKLA